MLLKRLIPISRVVQSSATRAFSSNANPILYNREDSNDEEDWKAYRDLTTAEFEATCGTNTDLQESWGLGVRDEDIGVEKGRHHGRPSAKVKMNELLEPKPDFNPHDEVFCFENFSQEGVRVPAPKRRRNDSAMQDLMMDDLGWNAVEEVPPIREVWAERKPKSYFATVNDEKENKSEEDAISKSKSFVEKPLHDITPLTEANLGKFTQLKPMVEFSPMANPEFNPFRAEKRVHERKLSGKKTDSDEPTFSEEHRALFQSCADHEWVMIRQPEVNLCKSLHAFRSGNLSDAPKPVTVLRGESGCGKSTSLTQVVQFARDSGWITLFIPDTEAWMKESPIMWPSVKRPGMFDQNEFATPILQAFLKSHAKELAKVKLQCSKAHRYIPSAMATLKGAENLHDFIQYALHGDDPDMDATSVLLDVLDIQITDFPVLVAIDKFNHLYEPTKYFHEELYIPPEKLSLVNAFRFFAADDEKRSKVKFEYKWSRGEPEYPEAYLKKSEVDPFSLPKKASVEPPRMPLKNGFVITAIHGSLPSDGVNTNNSNNRFRKLVDSRPYHVTVKRFSDTELESCLAHYKATGYLCLPPSEQVQSYFKMRYGSVPRRIFDATPQYFDVPLAEHPNMNETGGRRNFINKR